MIITIAGKTYDKIAINGEILFRDINTGLIYNNPYKIKKINQKNNNTTIYNFLK
jgi:hypothetical protein